MSIHKKVLPSGKVTWEVRWRDGGQRSRNFARKRDAEAFDSDIRRRRRLGDLELLDSGRETLADFAREWWQVYAMESLEPKTRKVYAEMWDKHVLTSLGGLELRRITPEVDRALPGGAPRGRPRRRRRSARSSRCSSRSFSVP